MSGPKGYDYSVDSAELERRQAVSAARSRCETRWRELQSQTAQVRALGGSVATALHGPPRIESSSSASDAEAIADEFERQTSAVATECASARSAAVARNLAANLPPRVVASIQISWQSSGSSRSSGGALRVESRPAPPAERTPSKPVADQVQEIAGRLFAALAEVLDETWRDGWFERASRLVDSARPSTSTVRTLAALEREVASHLGHQAATQLLRAEAQEIALTIADVQTPAANAARSALADADDRRSLDVAARLARTAREQHVATLERQFVVEQTVEALRELGYEVDEGFHAAAVDGDFVVATNAALPDHGLQFKFPASDHRVFTNAVALTDTTTVGQDVTAEKVTCRHLDLLESQVADNGIILRKFHEQLPGAVPIERRTERDRARSTGKPASRKIDSRRQPVSPRTRQR